MNNTTSANQYIFERYELKYMLTEQQRELLLKTAGNRLIPDLYSHSEIRNIYYDTPNYQLIRRSLEHPFYKEKLRMRSYQKAGADDQVFLELKKKYDSVVYKRRLALPQQEAADWLDTLSAGAGRHGWEDIATESTWPSSPLPDNASHADLSGSDGRDPRISQIGKEIASFAKHYPTLQPAVFLSYERDAFRGTDDASLRVTFDTNLRFRQEALTLSSSCFGTPILSKGAVLMEVKTSRALPLWLVHFLTGQGIYKTTFSKYGAAYERICEKEKKGERRYA